LVLETAQLKELVMKRKNITLLLLWISVFLIASFSVGAYDIASLKKDCVSMGYKLDSQGNAECALKLLKHADAHEKRVQEEQISALEMKERAVHEQVQRERDYQAQIVERESRASSQMLRGLQENMGEQQRASNEYFRNQMQDLRDQQRHREIVDVLKGRGSNCTSTVHGSHINTSCY
jgi:hypothetical protein